MSQQGFWNDDWMEVQRKYWENWAEIGQKAMGAPESKFAPWENAMEHWWKAISPSASDTAQDFMGKMMNQGKAFFSMAEQFSQAQQKSAGMSDWSDILGKTFSDMQNAFAGSTQGQGDDALHKMMAFWEMPLDNWQRMVSSLSLTPGDALRNMHHEAPHEHLDRFLSAPGLGYSREEQGQYQDMMRAAVNYQKALQEYMQFFSNLGVLSVDRMRQKVEALSSSGKNIDSARGLYDTWISACEEVYSEQVMTSQYAMIHGNLVNALMLTKRQMMNLVDEGCGTLNMPTRAELRTLQTRMQENRREIKALKREIHQLKGLLGNKAKAPTTQAAPAPAPAETAPPAAKAAPKRKAAPRKKAATAKK